MSGWLPFKCTDFFSALIKAFLKDQTIQIPASVRARSTDIVHIWINMMNTAKTLYNTVAGIRAFCKISNCVVSKWKCIYYRDSEIHPQTVLFPKVITITYEKVFVSQTYLLSIPCVCMDTWAESICLVSRVGIPVHFPLLLQHGGMDKLVPGKYGRFDLISWHHRNKALDLLCQEKCHKNLLFRQSLMIVTCTTNKNENRGK